jgi:hypothetical protein
MSEGRLAITIKKKADGSAALSCRRPDGSITWQRQDGRLGRFFPLHDLTHYAVETELGLDRAFYGLVAAGWDLTDFARPGAPAKLTPEAGLAELLVGFLDAERASGQRWSADDFRDKVRLYFASRGGSASLALDEDALSRIRSTRRARFERGDALPAGETHEEWFTGGGW